MAFTQGPLPIRLRLTQGLGAMAFGVKDSGFSFFLLIFYNQVLGMDAGLVGLALMLALVFDAVLDPLIGYFSDRMDRRLVLVAIGAMALIVDLFLAIVQPSSVAIALGASAVFG